MKRNACIAAIALGVLQAGCTCSFALNPSLDISQYGHTGWTARDGFSLGNIYAMAQTPDGYLWFGSEFGLFRYDGIRTVPWQPASGERLPDQPYSLLVTRDGTLWIGTFAGLASWNGAKLTSYPETGRGFVTSLFQDREGTVWAGSLGGGGNAGAGQLCAIRNGRAQCTTENGAFGGFVWGFYEDGSGNLWAGAESGLWQWKPGPPKHYAMPHAKISDLTRTDDGRPLIAVNGAGLKQFADGKVEPYPIRSANKQNALLADRDADSNKLLRDRDGGLWIGTVARGLIHVHQGRTDVFTKADGLSSNIVLCLFEDREGTIWVATTAGVDRFRELAVTTISVKEGLSSDATSSVAAAKDGSVWIATYNDLTRWNNGQFTIYGKASGLPDDVLRSLYEDDRGRIWVSSPRGLSYLMDGRFVTAAAIPSPEVGSITGDKAGNLWVSGNQGLSHLLDGRLVEHFPWSTLGRQQQASVVLFDPEQGGLWLSFWQDGGVEYFKDGQVRASYTVKDGLGQGPVPHLRLDREGTLWAATEGGGLSRIKNGHIATLTTRNGLPCDAIHWSMEDDDRSLWLYTACGVVRIARSELDAWIADTNHRVETTVWDAADGVRLRSVAAGAFGPLVTKSADGKLWFFTGEGVQVIDPHHLPDNKLPPPVHIENIVADHKTYWQNLPGAARSSVRLPALTRDLQIDFTALSMVAPEKVHFKYKLQGQDSDWREVVNDREVQYSNLPPASYQFRVIASNNSGFWNEQGDTVEFTIAPAFYQTNWFRALCAAAFLLLLWAAYQLRVRRLHREFALTLGARVGERTSIARDLHDTLLQSFHGLLVRFQIVSDLLPERPVEAKQHLDKAIDRAATAITEARDAVQGLRESTVEMNDLAQAVNSLAEELAADSANQNSPSQDSPKFRLTVEGESRDLHPILRDEIYRIAGESMRNAFCHAHARQIEVEIRYDDEQFRLRVRDDGKGFDRAVLSVEERPGHFGLAGMRERAKLIGGKLTVWSDVDEGTEVELRVPGAIVYTNSRRGSWLSQIFAGKP